MTRPCFKNGAGFFFDKPWKTSSKIFFKNAAGIQAKERGQPVSNVIRFRLCWAGIKNWQLQNESQQ